MNEQDTFDKLVGLLTIEQKLERLWDNIYEDEEVTPRDYGFILTDFGNIKEVKEWLETQQVETDTVFYITYGWKNQLPVIDILYSENVVNAFRSGNIIGSHGTTWDRETSMLNALLTEDQPCCEARDIYIKQITPQ